MGEAKRKRSSGFLAPWTPFGEAAVYPLPAWKIAAFARHTGMSEAEVIATEAEARARQKVFMNSRYTVCVDRSFPQAKGWPAMIWLSIKRNDRGPVGHERFRDFQRIKNELVGSEHEAVELYPAEARLIDTANQYHLWVLSEPGLRFPFGWNRRDVSAESVGGAIQQPFDDEALAKEASDERHSGVECDHREDGSGFQAGEQAAADANREPGREDRAGDGRGPADMAQRRV